MRTRPALVAFGLIGLDAAIELAVGRRPLGSDGRFEAIRAWQMAGHRCRR